MLNDYLNPSTQRININLPKNHPRQMVSFFSFIRLSLNRRAIAGDPFRRDGQSSIVVVRAPPALDTYQTLALAWLACLDTSTKILRGGCLCTALTKSTQVNITAYSKHITSHGIIKSILDTILSSSWLHCNLAINDRNLIYVLQR